MSTEDHLAVVPMIEEAVAPSASDRQDIADNATAIEAATQASTSAPPAKRQKREKELLPARPIEALSEISLRRLTRIKEGDSVLLRLPSDIIKAVTIQKDGLIQLGKYGAFPASQLLGLHYDITYEIVAGSSSTPQPEVEINNMDADLEAEAADSIQGKKDNNKGKKGKGKGKEVQSKNNPGWKNVLRPLKSQPLVDAVIDDITETNEFIDDVADSEKTVLSHEEIAELRAQGVSAQDIIKKQMERHERFGLKTDFSKEKWRKRKEKKFFQTVHPLAPSIPNILSHYSSRSPASILHLRADTLSQLLLMANIRPGGRYLVVDDTGGLVTAAILERMGSEGRILLFTDSDSPPAWGVLGTMNFSERELECVKWLNWMEADESYQRPAPPPEDDMPTTNPIKAQQRLRKHNAQVAELNGVRNELYAGGWDGLILATSLSPISLLSKLTPYLLGSTPTIVFSPHLQILAELLSWSKKDPNYVHDTLSESWERTYQVLPGRTHPMMTTSATGGYLWSAIRVHPSKFKTESHQRFKRKKPNKPSATTTAAAAAVDAGVAEVDSGSELEQEQEQEEEEVEQVEEEGVLSKEEMEIGE